MKPEKLTPAQQVFINEMVNGASQKQAYMTAYPGSSAEAAYSSASRLMDKPLIREKIEAEKEEVNWMKHQVLLRHKSERLAAITMQQQALTQIISGEWTKTIMITEKGKTRTIKCEPDPNMCLNACRLDYKLTVEYNKIMAGMNNKEILQALWQTPVHQPESRSQYVPFPKLEASGTEYQLSLENTDEMLAGLSNSYEKTLDNCGKNHCEPGAFLSMANAQDKGNSCCETSDIPANSCEMAADLSMTNGECNEEPGNETIRKASVLNDNRHMNRKQRRAAEQFRKRLAEKEEKLRILVNS